MSIFKGKTLLITGGTGSFGNAVLRRFLQSDIKEIRIFSRDEKKQDDMRHEYQVKYPESSNKIKFYIGDVRDLQSVKNAMHGFNSSYKNFENGSLEIFIDKAVNPELETEIYVNANMKHYPLRDYASMWNTMANVVKDYEKIGKRNKKKDDLHLNKHAMHLIRLFMMALDILEKGEINTYRADEHELLMDIRFGKYQNEDGTYKDSFYDILADFEKRLHYASENTDLPEEPDMKKVQELVMTINERVVRDEI